MKPLNCIINEVRPFFLAISLITLISAALLSLDNSGHRPLDIGIPSVAIVQHASVAALDEGARGVIDSLAKNGFIDGKTMTLTQFNAQGDLPTASDIALQVTNGSLDLVISISTPSLQSIANANKQGKVKHIYGVVTDASSSGVGVSSKNPNEHPPYMTGMSTQVPVITALKFALEANKKLRTIGIVWHSAEINSQIYTEDTRKACKELGIILLEATVENTSGVGEAAQSLVARGVDAIFMTGDVLVSTAADTVIAAAKAGHIPVFSIIPTNSKKGSLFDIGADFYTVGQDLGDLAASILNGADIANTPTSTQVPLKRTINLTALKGLRDNWKISPDMLEQATVYIDDSGIHHQRASTAAPTAVVTRPKKKIGIVYFSPEEGADLAMKGLIEGLDKNGYKEGSSLEVVKTHAQGEISNISMLIQNYDNQSLDLIVTLSTPVLTGASSMAKNKSVVFTYVYDPVAAGAGKSANDHLKNITGVSSFPPVEDTVWFITQLIPRVKSVGTVYNSSEANSRKVVEVARVIFNRSGIKLEEVTITSSSEILLAAQTLSQRGAQAIWITGDNTVLQGIDAVVKAANDSRLPLIINDPEFIKHGAIAAVGLGWYEAGYAGGLVASRVLSGESPDKIPFQEVAVKKVILNDSVAKRLGITFPKSLLEGATRVSN